ncbi:MAG: GNAT family N-acetyltransferase [Phycisphaerales bacterium]|nr:MAG: GNAT family N-acetyltransferase [Phycisphaerales bacterium]
MANPADLGKIVAAWPDEFGGANRNGYVRRKIAARFDAGCACLISEKDGRINGAVWCMPWKMQYDPQCLASYNDAFEICNLFVALECRGRGIGRHLLGGALSLMAGSGKRSAYSRVLPERQSSLALHLDCGFALHGVLHCSTVLGYEHNRFVPVTRVRHTDIRGTGMRACILLAQGAWGGTLEAIRSLGSRGVPVYVFVFDRDPKPYASSRYCRHADRLVGDDASSVCRELIDWCKAQTFHQRPLLVPMTDVLSTFVAETRASLDKYFIVSAPRPESVLSLLDKGQANSLAAGCGLEIPRSAIVKSRVDLKATAGTMTYPAIAKPVRRREGGSADFKTLRLTSSESLQAQLGPVLDSSGGVLVQEYIEGCDDSVETMMFYRDRCGRLWGCTARKLRQSPPNAGIMASGHAIDIPDLRRLCTSLLDHIDYHGFGGTEFKRSGDKLVYIETNARPEAIHGLARKAGLDLVWIGYCDYCLGGLTEEPYPHREAFYLDWAAFWNAFDGKRGMLQYAVNLLQMLCRRPLKIAVFELRDRGPTMYLVRTDLAARIHRFLRKVMDKAANGEPARHL